MLSGVPSVVPSGVGVSFPGSPVATSVGVSLVVPLGVASDVLSGTVVAVGATASVVGSVVGSLVGAGGTGVGGSGVGVDVLRLERESLELVFGVFVGGVVGNAVGITVGVCVFVGSTISTVAVGSGVGVSVKKRVGIVVSVAVDVGGSVAVLVGSTMSVAVDGTVGTNVGNTVAVGGTTLVWPAGGVPNEPGRVEDGEPVELPIRSWTVKKKSPPPIRSTIAANAPANGRKLGSDAPKNRLPHRRGCGWAEMGDGCRTGGCTPCCRSR